jgi:hypothetical protein
MSALEHGIMHAAMHITKNHGKEIGAAALGTVGTAVGSSLSSVGLTTAGTAVTSAASGALATAGTAVTSFATTVVAPIAATVAPIALGGLAVYGLYKLFSD